eukprot:349737-Chlamydomonas_euryale.AAC.1
MSYFNYSLKVSYEGCELAASMPFLTMSILATPSSTIKPESRLIKAFSVLNHDVLAHGCLCVTQASCVVGHREPCLAAMSSDRSATGYIGKVWGRGSTFELEYYWCVVG